MGFHLLIGWVYVDTTNFLATPSLCKVIIEENQLLSNNGPDLGQLTN
jgi:hypothetical protein